MDSIKNKDKNKTKERPLKELSQLPQKIAELKASETGQGQPDIKTLLSGELISEMVLEAIGEGISIQSIDFRILYQNKAHKNLVGDHVGEFCYKAYRQKEAICDGCPVDMSLKDGGVHKKERSLITDKGIMHVEVTSSPLKNPGGEIIAGIEVVRDITKRKLAEEALYKSTTKAEEERSKSEAIIAAIADGISIQDTNFKVLYQNQIHKDIAGSHAGEYCFRAYAKIDHVCEGCPIAESFKDGNIHTLDKTSANEKGALHVEIKASPLRDPTGNIIAGIEVVRNITDRKKMEESLRESEEKYRTLIENIQDGVFIIQDARFKFINKAFAEMVGYAVEELIGMDIRQLIYPDDLDMVMNRYSRRLAGEDVPREYEFRMLHKDGVTRIFINMVVGLVDYQGRTASMGTVKDITERKRMETEIFKTQKLESLSNLAGGIAHDFNNILTAITGNIFLAKMYAKPGLEIYDILTEAEKAGIRAKNLTKQLLTISKGGTPIKKTISIAALLKNSAEFALSGSNIKCVFSISDTLWHIEADEGQVSQVIHNIVVNAQQAMPGGGTIKIAAENITATNGQSLQLKNGAYIKIAVEDQGIGIPEEHLSKIFDPYFTTKQEGSGLGLATAYSIIKKHSGHITAESKLGIGTTFYIYLPALEDVVSAFKESEAAYTAVSGAGKVLVMDDDAIVRTVIGRMLNQCGYEAEYAEDGEKAIELYKKAKKSRKPFAAVIIDLVIPGGMGGKETIKKLLEIDPHVNAIVSSGYSDDSIMENFPAYGFKGALAKPYEISDMRQVLHRVVAEKT